MGRKNKIKIFTGAKQNMTDAKNDFVQSKNKFNNVLKKFKLRHLGCSMMNFSVRMLESIAVTMLSYVTVIGVAGNVVPYIAVSMANDAGIADIISNISSANIQSVISNLTNVFALWVFPMIVISTAIGFAVIKFLSAVIKFIHKKCNEITANNKAKLLD